jgi:hypothetical protein
VVLAAYERLKIFAPSITQKHMETARRELNLLLAEAANKQVNLWKVDLVSVPLVSGTSTYNVDAKTVMILDAWISQNSSTPTSANDLYITPVSRTEYASFSNKTTPGRPTSYWFDRLIAPTITLWPVPNASGYTLKYYRCIQMQDANLAGGETPDVPYLWLDWFIAGMAHRLARPYATMEVEKQRKADAVEAWTIAATQNVENTPTTLAPTISSYYRR